MRILTLIPIVAALAFLGGCGDGSLGTTIIANGGIVVRDARVTLHGDGGAEARLDADGTLQVDGRAIALDATQRTLLQQYYNSALAVRGHGIATGKAGAAMGVKSVQNVATRLLGDDDGQADAKLDAATRRIEQEAAKVCLDVRRIKAAQDRLATSLPAFKPFAGIIEDNGDCSS